MLKRFGMLLSASLKLLSLFSAVLPLRTLFSSKDMRRVVTADKVSVRFRYYEDEKEIGNVLYNMQDGHFFTFSWPSPFSPLRKAQELLRLLSFAVKIIRSEKCS